MKHLTKFEKFKVNEEILGLPKLSEIKAKAQKWLSEIKNKPEFKEALQNLKDEFAKLDPSTQAKLKSLSKETPEEIESEVKPELELVGESMINKGIDWKNILAKFFKVLGITGLTTGFITLIWGCITINSTGTGSTEMFGSTAGHVTAVGMATILAAFVPLIINVLITPEKTRS
jgi:hypothetical protein